MTQPADLVDAEQAVHLLVRLIAIDSVTGEEFPSSCWAVALATLAE